MKEFELLEEFAAVPPGPQAQEMIARHRGARFLGLTGFTITEDGKCAWCNVNPVAEGRRKYCSEKCNESGLNYCNPQGPATKAWILVFRQKGFCAGCGESFEDFIAEKIRKKLAWYQQWAVRFGRPFPEKLSLWLLGRDTGEIWHVDHVVPIFKGGDGIGFHNIQVLCVRCHGRKTAEERK